MTENEAKAAKRAAAHAAAELVSDGMKLGLGTGSTAALFVERVAERARDEGLKLLCVSTSEATEVLATDLGLATTTLDEEPFLDLTVDGADEVGPSLDLIKGAGGALFREKIVAAASDRMVVVADATKRVETLGACLLPLEVSPFGYRSTEALVLQMLGDHDVDTREGARRERGGSPIATDQGNWILDLSLKRIGDPAALDHALKAAPGVVETGLFIGMADAAIIGAADGSTTLLEWDTL